MDATLTPSDRLPPGATVSVYPVTNWPNSTPNFAAAPVGSATDSDTMGTTGVTFQGLTSGVRYVAYALVSSQHRYVTLNPGADSAMTVGQRIAYGSRTSTLANIAAETTVVTATPATIVGAHEVTVRLCGGANIVPDAASGWAIVRIKRDSTTIYQANIANNASTAGLQLPTFSHEIDENPGPGTYTYSATLTPFVAGNVDLTCSTEGKLELKVIVAT